MTIHEMQASLGLTAVPEFWNALFDEVSSQYDALSGTLLDPERIAAVIDGYNVLTAYRAEVLDAARELRSDKAAALYVCLVWRTMQLGRTEEASLVPLSHDTPGGRYALVFPLLAHLPENVAYLRSRGINEEMIAGTLYEFDRAVERHELLSGGVSAFPLWSFHWMQLFYENRLIRMGRLNFEMRYDFIGKIKAFRSRSGEIRLLAHGERIHRSGRPLGAALCTDEEGSFDAVVEETECAYVGHPIDETGRILRERVQLPKAEWSLALEHGDKVIAVHIPTGGSLDADACEEAYALARETFARCFPEFEYKAFSCVSWLMDRQLEPLSKPGANIVTFLKKYIPFQRNAPGVGVFGFVFMVYPYTNMATLDYNTLPADSSLRRALKQHYLNGGRIYEDGGLLFFCEKEK